MNSMVDKDFALFYGIMLGDGCLSLVYGKKKFITITGSLDNDLPFFKEVISPILFKLRGRETNLKFRKDSRAIEFNFVDNNLFDFISSFGFPIGKKGNKLFIPKLFYEKNLVNYVVSGFFSTDGSLVLTKNPNKYYPRLEAHVISKTLLEEVYNYLNGIGMRGGFYSCKRNAQNVRWKNTQDQFKFQFNGKKNLIIFNDIIGFANPNYLRKYLSFLEYDNLYSSNKMAAPRIELGTPSS